MNSAAIVVVAMVLSAVGLSWFKHKQRLKKANEAEAHRELIHGIFAEITEAFLCHGLIFTFRVDYGKLEGRTRSTDSGGFISIRQYLSFADDYIVELGHSTTVSSHEWQAEKDIHQQVMVALIYSRRSSHSQHFLRQNLLDLKKVGIDQVVADLVALLTEYDSILAAVEASGYSERLADSIQTYESTHAQLLGSVDVVINAYIPAKEEKTIAS